MSETDASLKFDEPPDGPATAPMSGEALSRSTVRSPATVVTNYVEIPAEGDAAFEPGTQLGPYRLVSKLGEGGMGIVFKAVHTKLDKTVAIKILPSQLISQKSALARFEREMKAVGRLQHPNVVQAFDAGEEKGTHFLVMEYVEGTDLQRLVMTRGPFSVENACKAVYQAALGLGAAHDMGLVHRDIKPSNLFVTKGGQIKILDLGLARLSNDDPEAGALTYSGQCFGTPEYMAPEQWEDVHACDGRTDLYALGCSLFFLLTGRPPYGGEDYKTAPRKMLGHINDAVPDLKKLRSDVPDELNAIYHKLMAKKSDQRYATSTELAEALSPWAMGGSEVTQVPGAPSGHTRVLPAAQTVPEKTLAQHSGRPVDTEVTQAFAADKNAFPTLLEPVARAGQTTFVPPETTAPGRTGFPAWLWPALGGAAAMILLTAGLLWLMKSGPSDAPPDGPNTVAQNNTTPDQPASNTTDKPEDPPSDQTELPPELMTPDPEKTDPAEVAAEEPLDPLMTEEPAAENPVVTLVGPIVVPDPVVPEAPSLPDPEPNPPFRLELKKEIVASTTEQDANDEPIEPLFEVEDIVVVVTVADQGPASLKSPFDQAAVQKARVAWAEELQIPPSVKNTIDMELVLIPPGEFAMGASDLEAKTSPSEKPQHKVKISKPIYVGKFEVLQREYQKVTGSNPSKFNKATKVDIFKRKVGNLDTDMFPVDSVTWHEAIEFCNKLSAREGLAPYYKLGGEPPGGNGYRLLTEAEWEYCCRAGTVTSYSFGATSSGKESNVGTTSGKPGAGGLKRTERAGSFPPNQFGLFDMHGNVSEWCFDWHDKALYSSRVGKLMVNPQGPRGGMLRVLRGGAWDLPPVMSRAAARGALSPNSDANNTGFRVARTP